MLTIEEIKKRKKEFGYTNTQLSQVSGVPLGTVQKVLAGATKSPGYNTMKALSQVFERNNTVTGDYNYKTDTEIPVPVDSDIATYNYETDNADVFNEAQPAYNINPAPFAENTHYYDRQGTYTLEDYLALPDDQRVELIDGVIYDMSAPTLPHQDIAGEIYFQLKNYINKNKGSCHAYIAPTDVQLDMDNRTIVQPDVMIVCDRSKLNRKRIFGAPDFIVEVLSPSTKKKDFYIKGQKYMNAGVREYWMIDPDEERIMVFDYSEGNLNYTLYAFDDSVPVNIYNGDCVIDFKDIRDQYAFIDG